MFPSLELHSLLRVCHSRKVDTQGLRGSTLLNLWSYYPFRAPFMGKHVQSEDRGHEHRGVRDTVPNGFFTLILTEGITMVLGKAGPLWTLVILLVMLTRYMTKSFWGIM